jgi:glycosyltransferase involved in cell wall biosynthesis
MRIIEVALSGTIGTDDMGPVSSVIGELSNNFAIRGHDVTVVDVKAQGARSRLHSDVEVVELEGMPQGRVTAQSRNRAIQQLKSWQNYYRCVRQLRTYLDGKRADVVHFHEYVPAFLAQRLYGIDPLTYTAHTPNWSLAPLSRSSVIGRLLMWVERAAIRRSRLTFALGDYLAAAVPNANIVTVPSGLDIEAWPVMDRGEARRALGMSEREFAVVFAGRIHPVKGIHTLLDAIEKVARSLPDVRVHLIGPLSGSFDSRDKFTEPYARKMQDRAQTLPVQFLGFINRKDLRYRQYLAAADVFVLPSRAEPQGLVVLEALAMGTPVIGSATGGIPGAVSSDVGYLFQPGDSDMLAARIREAHDHPDRLQAMRTAARDRVRRHYSWTAVADRYLAAFERCISLQ